MADNSFSQRLRNHVQHALNRYWPQGQDKIAALPVPCAGVYLSSISPDFVLTTLPRWAESCGVDGQLLVPKAALLSPLDYSWQQVDWWLAAFLMLECWHERDYERHHGPIHSLSLRLPQWDERVWQRAWVNRIALFIRAWAAHEAIKSDEDLFGPLPRAEIILTHDVDAISKTTPIRLKQFVFNMFNSVRAFANGEMKICTDKINSAFCFLFGSEDWWTFDALLEIEWRNGIRAHFNFYADTRKKNFKRWLFDPSYSISEARVKNLITRIKNQHGIIGLHPTYDSWNSPDLLREQKKQLTLAVGAPVTSCRQHWLRFSWFHTWTAQEAAGIDLDTTLMFNDRPGFRSAAALEWHPWDQLTDTAHRLKAMPTVLMDSQFYDYCAMTHVERTKAMKYWLDEIRFVGGRAAVLWHPHTLAGEYGWRQGFLELLNFISQDRSCQND